MFKTHLDVELGCNWIAQLEELGSVARFPNVKAALGTKLPLGLKKVQIAAVR